MDNNFEEIYQKIISELNKEDVEKLKTKKIESKYILIIAIISLVTCTFPLFIILLPILLISSVSKQTSNNNIFFKQNIIKKMIQYYNSSFIYNSAIGIHTGEYSKTWQEKYNRYHAEDDINGILKNNCRFEMSDVSAQYVTYDSEDREQVKTVFSGIFARIELPKNFIDELYICGKSKDIENLERVKMDSSEFEKNFRVYASNKIITFQLLTMDIMQSLIEYKQNNNIEFEICIKGNLLYIRYWTGDIFELGMGKEITDHDIIQKYYNILDFTVKLSERLSDIILEIQL